jgi:hypothetical protein
MLNADAITIGFMVACFVWTIWWNLDWRRCLKAGLNVLRLRLFSALPVHPFANVRRALH